MCTPPKGGGRRVLIPNIAQFSTGRAGIKSQLFAATPSIFEVNFRLRACQTRTLNVGVTPCVWQVDQVANPETSQQTVPTRPVSHGIECDYWMGRMTARKKISEAEIKLKLIGDAENPDAW